MTPYNPYSGQVPHCGSEVWEMEDPEEKLVGDLSINDTHQPLRF